MSLLRTPSRPATRALVACPALMSRSSASVLARPPYRRKPRLSVRPPPRLKLARRLAPSALSSGSCVYRLTLPFSSSEGRLVMMLTTPPMAPEP
ncbi:hypothetical protein D3C75_1157550 [compost metagenome]